MECRSIRQSERREAFRVFFAKNPSAVDCFATVKPFAERHRLPIGRILLQACDKNPRLSTKTVRDTVMTLVQILELWPIFERSR